MQIVIVLWNPDKKRLLALSLNDKIKYFHLAVGKACQLIRSAGHDAVGCIVAPDYLFEGGSASYTQKDFIEYSGLMQQMAAGIPDNILLIGGSMQWVQDNKIRVSCLYITNKETKRYDKKKPAGTERVGTAIFEAGTLSGAFVWNPAPSRPVHCGIEICQDHEEGVLVSTLRGHRKLDLQILISYGQCKRDRSVVLNDDGGLFIQCELDSKENFLQGKGEFGMVPYFNGVCKYGKVKNMVIQKQVFSSWPSENLAAIEVIGSAEECLGPMKQFECTLPGSARDMPQPELTTTASSTHPISSSSTGSIAAMRRLSDPASSSGPSSRPARPVWQPDSGVILCPLCRQEFGFFRRKHHCRECGKVVCDDCSSNTKHASLLPNQATRDNDGILEGGLLRVCYVCYRDTI